MKPARMILTVTTLIAGLAAAQTPAPATKAPISTNPIVDIQGTIVSLKMMPGQGMPVMEVSGARTGPVTVWLGSLRYLMEQKFSPKVGDTVEVKGYSLRNQDQEEEIVAIQVKLGGQVLKLRDENGWPVWRGGGPGFGMMRQGAANCPGGNCSGNCPGGNCGHHCGHCR